MGERERMEVAYQQYHRFENIILTSGEITHHTFVILSTDADELSNPSREGYEPVGTIFVVKSFRSLSFFKTPSFLTLIPLQETHV